MPFRSINPTNENLMAAFDAHDDQALDWALEKAEKRFYAGQNERITARAAKMRKAADILDERRDHYAGMMTREMGKPLKAARAEAEKCAWVCRYYADHAAEFLRKETVDIEDKHAFIHYQPIGPVLAVMPWNFPFWQVFRFAAPNLMAGNTGLLKHASNVPQCALAIEDIFTRAGFEEGCFKTLLIDTDKVSGILNDSRVRAATLTGSEKAGAAVASTAGKNIKKTVLELGGSDPFIIMPSADIEDAVEKAVTARMLNNGQSCIAAKRLIIHQDIYAQVRDKLIEKFQSLKLGDPMQEDTDCGPLATAQIRDELENQVEESIEKGARKLCGAVPKDGPGFFYQPGILDDIPDNSPAARDELFGPVASLFKAADLDGAIAIANATRFGLGAAIFTQDKTEKNAAIERIESGAVFINGIVASDPRLPFGGIKASGYGRELAREGMREFLNIKTVVDQ